MKIVLFMRSEIVRKLFIEIYSENIQNCVQGNFEKENYFAYSKKLLVRSKLFRISHTRVCLYRFERVERRPLAFRPSVES